MSQRPSRNKPKVNYKYSAFCPPLPRRPRRVAQRRKKRKRSASTQHVASAKKLKPSTKKPKSATPQSVSAKKLKPSTQHVVSTKKPKPATPQSVSAKKLKPSTQHVVPAKSPKPATPQSVSVTKPNPATPHSGSVTKPTPAADVWLRSSTTNSLCMGPFIALHPRYQLLQPSHADDYTVKDRAFLLGLDVRGSLEQITRRMHRHLGLGSARHVRFLLHASHRAPLRALLEAYAIRVMMPTEVDSSLTMLETSAQPHLEPEPNVYYKQLFRFLNQTKEKTLKLASQPVSATVVFQFVKSDTPATRELKAHLLQHATDKDIVFPRKKLQNALETLYRQHTHDTPLSVLFWRAFLFARETEGNVAFTQVLQSYDKTVATAFSSPWSVFLALFLPCIYAMTPAKLAMCASLLLNDTVPDAQRFEQLYQIMHPLPHPQLHQNSALTRGLHYLRLIRRHNPWPNGIQHPIHVWRYMFTSFMADWQQRIGNAETFRNTVLIPILKTLGTTYSTKWKRARHFITAIRHVEEARMHYVETRWRNGVTDPPHRHVRQRQRPLVQPTTKSTRRYRYNFFEATDRLTYFDPDPSVSQCPKPSTALHPAWKQQVQDTFKTWLATWTPTHQPCNLHHLLKAFETHWNQVKSTLQTKLSLDAYSHVRRHLRGEPPFLELKDTFLIWLEHMGKRMTGKKLGEAVQKTLLSSFAPHQIRIH